MRKKFFLFLFIFLPVFLISAAFIKTKKTDFPVIQESLSSSKNETSFSGSQTETDDQTLCSHTEEVSANLPALAGIILLLLLLSFGGTAVGILLALLWFRIQKRHDK